MRYSLLTEHTLYSPDLSLQVALISFSYSECGPKALYVDSFSFSTLTPETNMKK